MLKYISNDTKVEDVDSVKGIVKAYYSVNGNIDSDGDIIEPGAGAKTIKERGPEGSNRIKHFKWHDLRYAPGVLQKLGEDEFGGYFISKLLSTTLGKDTLIEYQEGAITEHSFGFEVIKEDKDDAGINHVKEYKLWEVSSLIAWGANPLTRVDFVKNIKTEAEAITALENITKLLKIGSFSDGYLEKMEKAYTDLSAIYKSLISKDEPHYVTCKNGHKFDYNSIPEKGMGWVECPFCQVACTQKEIEPIELIESFNFKL